jgi:hypothetical protein
MKKQGNNSTTKELNEIEVDEISDNELKRTMTIMINEIKKKMHKHLNKIKEDFDLTSVD